MARMESEYKVLTVMGIFFMHKQGEVAFYQFPLESTAFSPRLLLFLKVLLSQKSVLMLQKLENLPMQMLATQSSKKRNYMLWNM